MHRLLALLLSLSLSLSPFLFPRSASAEEPGIRLVDFAGRPVAFADVQRDATLVAFWMSLCPPCIEEMPLLEALYKKEAGSGSVAVIGVNLDGDGDDKLAAAKKVLDAHKVSYPMLRDPKFALIRTWFPDYPDGTGLPLVVVLDRQSHALSAQGLTPGTTAAQFIAEWSPRLAAARTGQLREPLQRLVAKKSSTPPNPKQMAEMIEKMVRARYPKLADEEIRKRVEVAAKQLREKGRFELE